MMALALTMKRPRATRVFTLQDLLLALSRLGSSLRFDLLLDRRSGRFRFGLCIPFRRCLSIAAGLRFAAWRGRVAAAGGFGFGFFLVAGVAVVGDVEAAALEDQARAGADQSAGLVLAALRASLGGRG